MWPDSSLDPDKGCLSVAFNRSSLSSILYGLSVNPVCTGLTRSLEAGGLIII